MASDLPFGSGIGSVSFVSQPIRYKYDHHEDAVLVTVDFPAEVAAEAFAMRFDGVDRLSPQPASSDSPRQLPAEAVRYRR